MIATMTMDEAIDLRALFQPFARLFAACRRVVRMATAEVSDADKEGLADEELEALNIDLEDEDDDGGGTNDDDDGGGGGDDDKGKGDNKDDDDDAGGDDDDDKTKSGKKEEDASDSDDDAGDDDASSGAEDVVTKPLKVPALQLAGVSSEDLKKAQESLDSAKKAYEEARQKFEDGDIDFIEYEQIKDEYNEAKWAIRELKLKAESAQEINVSSRQAAWEASQELFYDQNRDFATNPVLNKLFVREVNDLIQDPETAKLSDMELLLKAKKIVEEDLGIATGNGKSGGKSTDASGKSGDDLRRKAARAKSKKDMDAAAKNKDLTGVPAADAGDDDDEFAWLDRLQGEEYERAIEQLTPEQRAKYEDRY